MRHRVSHRKLGRTSEHRKALLRNLCTSLIIEEGVTTTLAKAKELRPFAERAITLARHGNAAETPERGLSCRRLAAGYFIGGHGQVRFREHKKEPVRTFERTGGVRALKKLFDEVAPRFATRPGGYTRITKLGWRKGDGAPMAKIELIPAPVEKKAAETAPKKGGLFSRKKKPEA
ncbi:MAG: 50S ribosomal protein L17 [Acidobacteria bacterium]|nr:50S ribosomal protein L17 [Acidobacteriota bacterium]